MPSLWFVVPAHGRIPLARICLAQLRRTCDTLTSEGVEASAVVVACDENLETARELGFGTVERDNRFLSARYNDGVQLALDEQYNPRPVDYVVPLGSDDWVDWRLFTDPDPHRVVAFRKLSFVREDGREMTARLLRYEGGCGIRIYPRKLLEATGFRPADEDRRRGCDTSILVNLRRRHGDDLKVDHRDTDARQIVDWKSAGEQLNSYQGLEMHLGIERADPFQALAGMYPAQALEQMAAHYDRALVAA